MILSDVRNLKGMLRRVFLFLFNKMIKTEAIEIGFTHC